MNGESLQLLEIQQIGTSILREIVSICDRYGIIYYLVGGTELGAVRHKGFIPWDDDVDIVMTMENQRKFIKAAWAELSEQLMIDDSFAPHRDFIPDILRVCHKGHRVQDISMHNVTLGVDIMTLVGLPKNPVMRNIFYYYIMFRKTMTRISRPEIIGINYWKNQNWMRRLIIRMVKAIRFDKLLSYEKSLLRLKKTLEYFPVEKAEYVMVYPSPYGKKEMVPRSYYGDGTKGEFEGFGVRLPSRYHDLLTRIYGDYMTPPPESERTIHYEQMEEY